MSLREKMNKNPVLSGIIVLALVAAAGWFCYSALTDRGGQGDAPKFYYYTVDDGKTMFSAPADELPPIMKDGKEAVRVRIFTCDGGKTPVVTYMEKYTDAFKKAYDAEKAKPIDPKAKGPTGVSNLMSGPAAAFAMQLKKPGDATWVQGISPAGIQLQTPKCPSGKPEDVVEKLP